MTQPGKSAHEVATNQYGIVTSYVDPVVAELWIDECEQRSIAIDQGKMMMIDADEVMQKYRK